MILTFFFFTFHGLESSQFKHTYLLNASEKFFSRIQKLSATLLLSDESSLNDSSFTNHFTNTTGNYWLKMPLKRLSTLQDLHFSKSASFGKEFFSLIDIHTHILPGVDDGAPSEADSLEMARLAIEEGIHTIVATPHHKNGRYDNDRESILAYTKILNDLFQSEGIPLTLLPGQETRINGDMVMDLERQKILPINDSNYVFVEFPSRHIPKYTEQLLYEIQLAGYVPVIVHPERNEAILKEPNRLYDFVRKGSLAQITAGSIVGKFGHDIRNLSHQLLDAHLIHFIASDAHNTTSRSFWMREAHEEVKKTYGMDLLYFFLENSQRLVDGMTVHKYEPMRVKRKRFFGLF